MFYSMKNFLMPLILAMVFVSKVSLVAAKSESGDNFNSEMFGDVGTELKELMKYVSKLIDFDDYSYPFMSASQSDYYSDGNKGPVKPESNDGGEGKGLEVSIESKSAAIARINPSDAVNSDDSPHSSASSQSTDSHSDEDSAPKTGHN